MRSYILRYILHLTIISCFIHTVCFKRAVERRAISNVGKLSSLFLPEIAVLNEIETDPNTTAITETREQPTELDELGETVTLPKEQENQSREETTELLNSETIEPKSPYKIVTEFINLYTRKRESIDLNNETLDIADIRKSIKVNNQDIVNPSQTNVTLEITEKTTESITTTEYAETTEHNKTVLYAEVTTEFTRLHNETTESNEENTIIISENVTELSNQNTDSILQNNESLKIETFTEFTSLVNQNISYLKENNTTTLNKKIEETEEPVPHELMPVKANKSMKYILLWTTGHNAPFNDIVMSKGRQVFIDRKCAYTNCIITKRRYFLEDYTDFDAVVFLARDLMVYRKYMGTFMLPERRSLHQKYVFASLDYAYKYQPSAVRFNYYFNWTWTYRLNSDLTWTYFVVKDKQGNIVAPKKDVRWMKPEDMLPVSDDLRKILFGKERAIAWFDSCSQSPKFYSSIWKLIKLLDKRFGISVHKFGKCWQRDCSTKENSRICNEMLKKHYHFYLAYENVISPDFVTDNLLQAIENYAVPIVYGGADYSRFLPDGSYIDVKKESLWSVAAKINELLMVFDKYVEYFKWTNHYTFHRADESNQTDYMCKVCEIMNDEKKINERQVYRNFTNWWGIQRNSLKKRPVGYDSIYRISKDRDILTSIELQKKKNKSLINPWKYVIAKTASVISHVFHSMVSDVKLFWNELTKPQPCSHRHYDSY